MLQTILLGILLFFMVLYFAGRGLSCIEIRTPFSQAQDKQDVKKIEKNMLLLLIKANQILCNQLAN